VRELRCAVLYNMLQSAVTGLQYCTDGPIADAITLHGRPYRSAVLMRYVHWFSHRSATASVLAWSLAPVTGVPSLT